MKQKLTFEAETYEDHAQIKRITQVDDAFGALDDYAGHLRTRYKHDDTLSQEQHDLLEQLRNKFYDILDDWDINLV